MGAENGAGVTGLAEQDTTPIVDERRDVSGPVDFGDLAEDRSQEIVEHDLAVELHDQVVDIGAVPKVVMRRSGGHGAHEDEPTGSR